MLIFDEVQCGVGRTGYPFAANMYGVTPDMITTAKALGNGFPCAVLMMSDRVARALKMDMLGTTFGAGSACLCRDRGSHRSHRIGKSSGPGTTRRRVRPQDLHRGDR